MPDISNVGPVDYSKNEVPKDYVCSDCGATGVRLYREYQTFINHSSLNCTACALKRYKRSHEDKDYDMEGKDITYEIGWMVYAVPTEDGRNYWGYSSCPPEGSSWWKNLPEKL